jgi:hypothetical protein
MGSTDALRILTQMDIGPILSGMNGAADAVTSGTGRMNADFQKMQAQFESTVAGMRAEAEQLQARVAELEAQLANVGKRGISSATEARHAMRGLGEEIGIHMPRFVSTFLSSLGPVATVAAAAFTPIAIVGMIQVLGQIPGAIEKGISSLRGWDAEAKKTFEDSQAHIIAMTRAMIDGANSISKAQATAGKSGLVRTAAEKEALDKEIANYEKYQTTLKAQLSASENVKKSIEVSWKGIGSEMLHAFEGMPSPESSKLFLRPFMGPELDQAKTNIGNLKKQIEDLDLTLVRLRAQAKIVPIESAGESAKEIDETKDAKITADHQAALAKVETDKAALEEERRLNKVTLDEYVAQAKAIAAQELAINLATINQKRAQARAEEKTVGTPAGPKMEALRGEEVAARETTAREVQKIETTAAAERITLNENETKARIENQKRYQLAVVAGEEEVIKEQYAAHQISAAQETARLTGVADQRFGIERAALVKEVEEAGKQGEKKRALLITLLGQLQTLEVEHANSVQAIKAEGTRKEIADRQIAEEIALRDAEETAAMELKYAQFVDAQKLKSHQISMSQYAKDQQAALDKNFNDMRTAMDKWIAFMEANNEKGTRQYQMALAKRKELYQKYILDSEKLTAQLNAKEQAAILQMQSLWNGAFTQWITGHETLAKAVVKAWDTMLVGIVNNLLKMLEQMLVNYAMQKAASSKNILQQAKEAAAKAYNAMAGIPYVGPVLGAAAAAAVFAGVMAFGTAAKGAVAPEDMMMFQHAKEMTLPAHLSTGVEAMVKAYTSGAGAGGPAAMRGPAPTINYQPTVYGEKQWAKKMLRQHSDELGAIVQQLMRDGKVRAY